MPSKEWDEITYPFSNHHRIDKLFRHTLRNGRNYLSMLEFNLIHISEKGPAGVRYSVPFFIRSRPPGPVGNVEHRLRC